MRNLYLWKEEGASFTSGRRGKSPTLCKGDFSLEDGKMLTFACGKGAFQLEEGKGGGDLHLWKTQWLAFLAFESGITGSFLTQVGGGCFRVRKKPQVRLLLDGRKSCT